ncbi:PLP-dependent aminotransferase family protein [Reinekea sp. G2M2-21]|uniref:aminotransferase-like domain-containing protein n=1 Tax=Reinekea sp. G2M2-21 TaxID=2788942 RepID=UPI0018AB527A|nr:PLP-dependent aminotransferase family protein [Reinekea sp. G2M2-21]
MESLLYAQLADNLIEHIQAGVYKVGEKMPSVRALAKAEQVSIATVNSAYAILEDRGWAEARPKSGYFVKRSSQSSIGLPSQIKVKTRPRAVTTKELALEVQREASSVKNRNFSCAIPDLKLSIASVIQKTFTRLSRAGSNLGEGYDATEGLFDLRQQVARRGIDGGVHISPESIITTVGAQNAISLALRAITQPGDIIAVESPCYFGLLQMIEAFGLKAIEIPADSETGMSVEALKLALQQWPIKTILCISTFSNPLGCTIPDEHKKEILDLVVEHDICLIEDDIYGELQFEGRRPKTFKAFDPDGRVLWCSSVSKTMDPQLRVGWIAPGRYYDEVLRQKYTNYLASPSLPQAVTADVMSKGLYDRHLRQARLLYKQRSEQLRDFARLYFPEETRASSPKGGLVTWFEMPKKVDATALYHQCRELDIRIAPGELFSISGLYKNYFRLNFANEWSSEREAALKTIGEHLKQAIHQA